MDLLILETPSHRAMGTLIFENRQHEKSRIRRHSPSGTWNIRKMKNGNAEMRASWTTWKSDCLSLRKHRISKHEQLIVWCFEIQTSHAQTAHSQTLDDSEISSFDFVDCRNLKLFMFDALTFRFQSFVIMQIILGEGWFGMSSNSVSSGMPPQTFSAEIAQNILHEGWFGMNWNTCFSPWRAEYV